MPEGFPKPKREANVSPAERLAALRNKAKEDMTEGDQIEMKELEAQARYQEKQWKPEDNMKAAA